MPKLTITIDLKEEQDWGSIFRALADRTIFAPDVVQVTPTAIPHVFFVGGVVGQWEVK